MKKKIVVVQDGREFYNSENGQFLYRASITVKDFDIDAAKLARHEFLQFADRQDWQIFGEIGDTSSWEN